MLKGNTKLFLDKQKLYQMLNLRRNGLTITTLAIMFDCDHTSIQAQCDKYGIHPIDEVYGIERIIAQVIPFYQSQLRFRLVCGEKINIGRSYKEYLSLT